MTDADLAAAVRVLLDAIGISGNVARLLGSVVRAADQPLDSPDDGPRIDGQRAAGFLAGLHELARIVEFHDRRKTHALFGGAFLGSKQHGLAADQHARGRIVRAQIDADDRGRRFAHDIVSLRGGSSHSRGDWLTTTWTSRTITSSPDGSRRR